HMSRACPTESQLQAFAVGNLASTSVDELAEHLNECPDCQTALARFDTYRDSLLGEIAPAISAAPLALPAAVLTSAMAAITDAAAGQPPAEPTIDTGLHYARLLKEGPCRLGRFELLAEVGVGSFGYVFRARDVELDRIVAIKVQRAGAFATQEEAGRF